MSGRCRACIIKTLEFRVGFVEFVRQKFLIKKREEYMTLFAETKTQKNGGTNTKIAKEDMKFAKVH